MAFNFRLHLLVKIDNLSVIERRALQGRVENKIWRGEVWLSKTAGRVGCVYVYL